MALIAPTKMKTLVVRLTGLTPIGATQSPIGPPGQGEDLDIIHALPDGSFVLSASGLKRALVRSVPDIGDKKLSKILVRGAVWIDAPDGKIPVTGTLGEAEFPAKKKAVKLMPCLSDWAAEVTVSFDSENVSGPKVLLLFRTAGKKVGVGRNRPELGGTNGQWEAK